MGKSIKYPMKISIITTSTFEGHGSMAVYARLVLYALSLTGHDKLDIKVVCLGPSQKFLKLIPRFFRTVIYHGWLIIKAMKLRKLKSDILHLTDGSCAHVLKWLPAAIPSVVTSHDIIPFLQAKGRFPVAPPPKISRWIIKQSIQGIKRAHFIVADSERTRNDLITHAHVDPDKIDVIYPAIPLSIDEQRAKIIPLSWKERRTSQKAYILHVGNDGFYKNRKGVVNIFNRIRQKVDIRLIMVGPKPSEELSGLVGSTNLSGYVEFVVQPEDEVMARLYSNACLFLFPSLYEGFGWPPLEAMVLQCPVVCSNRASLPEVVGDAALTDDPDDEEFMAELCLSVLQDELLANQLIEKGLIQAEKFCAEEMGRQIIDVYTKVITQEKIY